MCWLALLLLLPPLLLVILLSLFTVLFGPGARVGERFEDAFRAGVLTAAAPVVGARAIAATGADSAADSAVAVNGRIGGCALLDSVLPLLFSLSGDALLLLEEVPLLLREVSRARRFFLKGNADVAPTVAPPSVKYCCPGVDLAPCKCSC